MCRIWDKMFLDSTICKLKNGIHLNIPFFRNAKNPVSNIDLKSKLNLNCLNANITFFKKISANTFMFLIS